AAALRLRALARENAALKRLVGALTLDTWLWQDGLGNNWEAWRPRTTRRPIWRRRIPAVSAVPAVSWRSTAARNGGRQASRHSARCCSGCIGSRRSLRAVGPGRLTLSGRAHSGGGIVRPFQRAWHSG